MQRNKSIYHIQADHWQLMQEIEENDGEITPEIDQRLGLTKDQFEEKAVSYGYLMKHINDEAVILRNEIDRLQGILKAKNTLEAQLKERVTQAMQSMNIDKVSKDNLTLSFRKSDQLIVSEDAQLPSKYLTKKLSITPDKALLKADVKAGKKIKGVQLITKQNLQIK